MRSSNKRTVIRLYKTDLRRNQEVDIIHPNLGSIEIDANVLKSEFERIACRSLSASIHWLNRRSSNTESCSLIGLVAFDNLLIMNVGAIQLDIETDRKTSCEYCLYHFWEYTSQERRRIVKLRLYGNSWPPFPYLDRISTASIESAHNPASSFICISVQERT